MPFGFFNVFDIALCHFPFDFHYYLTIAESKWKICNWPFKRRRRREQETGNI